MTFNQQRRKFISDNLNRIVEFEQPFLITTDLRCSQIKNIYSKNCNKAQTVSKIREFYDTNWYSQYSNQIQVINNLKDLKLLMEKLQYFKTLLKISEDFNESEMLQMEDFINKCVQYRIQFKYQCLKEDERNKEHDAEILRVIFHSQRFSELKQLFIEIKQKYREELDIEKSRRLKEMKRQQEVDEIIADIEKLSDGSQESLGEPFQIVVSKKKMKTSRPKYRKK